MFPRKPEHKEACDINASGLLDHLKITADLLNGRSFLDLQPNAIRSGLDAHADGIEACCLHQLQEFFIETIQANPVGCCPTAVDASVDQRSAHVLRICEFQREIVVNHMKLTNAVFLLKHPDLIDDRFGRSFPQSGICARTECTQVGTTAGGHYGSNRKVLTHYAVRRERITLGHDQIPGGLAK